MSTAFGGEEGEEEEEVRGGLLEEWSAPTEGVILGDLLEESVVLRWEAGRGKAQRSFSSGGSASGPRGFGFSQGLPLVPAKEEGDARFVGAPLPLSRS